jgi:hypothetical protein
MNHQSVVHDHFGPDVTGKPAAARTLVAEVVFEQSTGGQRDCGCDIVSVARQLYGPIHLRAPKTHSTMRIDRFSDVIASPGPHHRA